MGFLVLYSTVLRDMKVVTYDNTPPLRFACKFTGFCCLQFLQKGFFA